MWRRRVGAKGQERSRAASTARSRGQGTQHTTPVSSVRATIHTHVPQNEEFALARWRLLQLAEVVQQPLHGASVYKSEWVHSVRSKVASAVAAAGPLGGSRTPHHLVISVKNNHHNAHCCAISKAL
jgi:hypothetical protein